MKKLSLPVIGMGVGAVLALGVGGAFAVGGQVQPTSDESVYVAPSEEATPTAEPTPTAVVEAPVEEPPAPVVLPVEEPRPATVEDVTEPAAPDNEIADPESIGTTGSDGVYTPAPPRPVPGEPSVLPPPPPPPVSDEPELPPIKNG